MLLQGIDALQDVLEPLVLLVVELLQLDVLLREVGQLVLLATDLVQVALALVAMRPLILLEDLRDDLLLLAKLRLGLLEPGLELLLVQLEVAPYLIERRCQLLDFFLQPPDLVILFADLLGLVHVEFSLDSLTDGLLRLVIQVLDLLLQFSVSIL